MDQIPLNTSSQSDIDEIESLFHISVQPATLEVPPSVAPAQKPSSPPATIPVSVPLLPPSSVSSSSQAFSTPQPPPAHSSGLWAHFTCPCVSICRIFLPGLCPSSTGLFFCVVSLYTWQDLWLYVITVFVDSLGSMRSDYFIHDVFVVNLLLSLSSILISWFKLLQCCLNILLDQFIM